MVHQRKFKSDARWWPTVFTRATGRVIEASCAGWSDAINPLSRGSTRRRVEESRRGKLPSRTVNKSDSVRPVRACRRCLTRSSSPAGRIPSRGSRSSKIIRTPRCQPQPPSKFRGAFAIERAPVLTDKRPSTTRFPPLLHSTRSRIAVHASLPLQRGKTTGDNDALVAPRYVPSILFFRSRDVALSSAVFAFCSSIQWQEPVNYATVRRHFAFARRVVLWFAPSCCQVSRAEGTVLFCGT